jgi:hypothetical protein
VSLFRRVEFHRFHWICSTWNNIQCESHLTCYWPVLATLVLPEAWWDCVRLVGRLKANTAHNVSDLLSTHESLIRSDSSYYFYSNPHTDIHTHTHTHIRRVPHHVKFDAQNHVKCAFWRMWLRTRTLIKRYDHVRVYSQKGMTMNDLQTAAFMSFTNGILQVQKMTLTETVRVK